MALTLRRSHLAEWAPFLVRAGVGSAMLVNGAGKLFGIGPSAIGLDAFAAYLASIGVPFPVFFSWAAALAEGVGGLLILLGLFTRFAAVFVAVTMIVAAFLVHIPAGFPTESVGTAYTIGEYTWVLIVTSGSLILSGPGRLSLEHALFGRELLPSALTGEAEPTAPVESRRPGLR